MVRGPKYGNWVREVAQCLGVLSALPEVFLSHQPHLGSKPSGNRSGAFLFLCVYKWRQKVVCVINSLNKLFNEIRMEIDHKIL